MKEWELTARSFVCVGVIFLPKPKNTVQSVTELCAPLVEKEGLSLWDVRFEKEGSLWYLRVILDKTPGAVNIDDCERVSRALSTALDEADPIEQSYILEVSSPGIERSLTREAHFLQSMGREITLRLIRPLDGERDFSGMLSGFSGDVITLTLPDGSDLHVKKSDTAFVKWVDTIGGEDDE